MEEKTGLKVPCEVLTRPTQSEPLPCSYLCFQREHVVLSGSWQLEMLVPAIHLVFFDFFHGDQPARHVS